MIKPDGVLDGDHGETVAVWFGVGHGQSDYPDPIKATQPFMLPAGVSLLVRSRVSARPARDLDLIAERPS